jgi:hypothetical protein
MNYQILQETSSNKHLDHDVLWVEADTDVNKHEVPLTQIIFSGLQLVFYATGTEGLKLRPVTKCNYKIQNLKTSQVALLHNNSQVYFRLIITGKGQRSSSWQLKKTHKSSRRWYNHTR